MNVSVHTDASQDDTVVGLAYVICNANDGRLHGKHFIRGEYTSMEAEAYAMLQGIAAVKERTDADAIDVYADCRPMIQKVSDASADEVSEKWFDLQRTLTHSLEDFESYTLSWEKRDSSAANEDADRYAKEALWQARDRKPGCAKEGVSFETIF